MTVEAQDQDRKNEETYVEEVKDYKIDGKTQTVANVSGSGTGVG
jgi:hypothetical protein